MCCRKLVQRHIEAMYEVYKFFFGESFEQVAAYMSQGVPSHMGYFVFMPGGLNNFTSVSKMPKQSAFPSSECRHISCIPRQIPSTGCFKFLITSSNRFFRRWLMVVSASPTPGKITLFGTHQYFLIGSDGCFYSKALQCIVYGVDVSCIIFYDSYFIGKRSSFYFYKPFLLIQYVSA